MPETPERAIDVKLEYIKKDIAEIKTKLDDHYVTSSEFEPIKKIVYGMVSLVLVTVFGALLALILTSNV